MKLKQWASIAEIIAAVGVILSLLFVGFQVRDGNREARAATVQAALDSEIALNAEMLRHGEVWAKIASGAPLEGVTETRRGIVLFNMLMTTIENRWIQFESGYLENSPNLEQPISFPFYETWRGSGGAMAKSPQFLERLDELYEQRNNQ